MIVDCHPLFLRLRLRRWLPVLLACALVGLSYGRGVAQESASDSAPTLLPPVPEPRIPEPYLPAIPQSFQRHPLSLPPFQPRLTIEPIADSQDDEAAGERPNFEGENREKQERIEKLRRQIEELRKLQSQPRRPAEPAAAPAPENLTPPAAVEVLTPEPQPVPAPPEPGLPAEGKPDSLPVDSSRSLLPGLPATTGSVVVEGPVDRLGLADSLFATGQIPLALEMYSQLETSSYPPDVQQWIAYQQASCYRRLDNLPEAEKRYRLVVASSPPGWLADLCRWWLAAIAERKRLGASTDNLKRVLNSLGTELDQQLKSERKP